MAKVVRCPKCGYMWIIGIPKPYLTNCRVCGRKVDEAKNVVFEDEDILNCLRFMRLKEFL